MLHSSRAAIIVAVLSPLLACSGPEGDEYAPVGKFESCDYDVQFMGPAVGLQHGKAVSRRVGQETIGGHRYVKQVMVFSGVPGLDPTTGYYRKAKDGVYAIEGEEKDRHEHLATPLPLKVGTKWTTTQGGDFVCDCKAEAVETAELVETRYERSLKVACSCHNASQSISTQMHLAPGLGMVRQTVKAPNMTIEWTLQQCKG